MCDSYGGVSEPVDHLGWHTAAVPHSLHSLNKSSSKSSGERDLERISVVLSSKVARIRDAVAKLG